MLFLLPVDGHILTLTCKCSGYTGVFGGLVGVNIWCGESRQTLHKKNYGSSFQQLNVFAVTLVIGQYHKNLSVCKWCWITAGVAKWQPYSPFWSFTINLLQGQIGMIFSYLSRSRIVLEKQSDNQHPSLFGKRDNNFENCLLITCQYTSVKPLVQSKTIAVLRWFLLEVVFVHVLAHSASVRLRNISTKHKSCWTER